MTSGKLLGRVAALEAVLSPAGRLRVFRLPGDMQGQEADAWIKAHAASPISPADTVVAIRWLGVGQRPAELCGEVAS